VMVLLVACLIFVPLVLLITYIVQQIIAGVHQLQASGGLTEWRTIVEFPPSIKRALDWAEANLNLQAGLQRVGQMLVGQAGGLLAGSVTVITQVVFVLFVLFFLYRDGEMAMRGLRKMVPLSDEEATRMFRRIEDTILATVNGSLTVAFIQAMLAGIMYTALGVPASVIWAATTFIAALLPVFGTVLVWGPISLFLLLSGSWVKALILVAWGGLAVGTIDNILYPYLVGGRLRLHTLPTFFAIVGGVGVFGPAGLILGPVVLAVTIGLLDVWHRRTAGGGTAEQPVQTGSTLVPLPGETKT
jgi:predicted PurR-regulated permease PerM